MVHHFDHRFGTYEGQTEAQSKQGKCPEFTDADHDDPTKLPLPYYWVDEAAVAEQLEGRWSRSWLLGWRDICRTSDMRTVICSIMPRAAVGHTTPLILGDALDGQRALMLLATFSSFVFDYCSRQKVGGTHLTFTYLKQLPIPSPALMEARLPWSQYEPGVSWIRDRVVELVYTAHDMAGLAADCGYDGPPFRWELKRRAILRAELDAAFFHIYGVDRADTDYILDTFPVLRDKETREHGEYRTKRLVLERYDALAAAITSGTPYVSPLSPPPADPRAAHPVREAEIFPLPRRIPAPRPLPAWGHDIFAEAGTRAGIAPKADAWSTNLSGEQFGMSALAAVLRGLPAPAAREDVERAVVLVVLPRLMQPHFDGTAAKRWRSVVGKKDFAVASVTAFAIPWGNVLRKAIQQRVLAEGSNGLWYAGPDVGDAPAPALDARALVALSWLATAPAQDVTVEQEFGVLRVA